MPTHKSLSSCLDLCQQEACFCLTKGSTAGAKHNQFNLAFLHQARVNILAYGNVSTI